MTEIEDFNYMFPAVTDNELPSAVITEIAKGTEEASTIFARHGIPPEVAAKAIQTQEFRRALSAAKNQWLSADNVAERIRTKSLFCMEELLPTQFEMAIDRDVAPAARNEAVKIFKSLAGMDKADAIGAGAGGFSIVLNLGGVTEPKEIVVEPSPHNSLGLADIDED